MKYDIQTISEVIAGKKRDFLKLSASRRKTLRREAFRLIKDFPHCASASTFWRGLSAQHVLETGLSSGNWSR